MYNQIDKNESNYKLFIYIPSVPFSSFLQNIILGHFTWKYTCSTYIGHIVTAVLLFGTATAVLLALFVLEGSVILSELFAVLKNKAERTLLMRERCCSQDARGEQTHV